MAALRINWRPGWNADATYKEEVEDGSVVLVLNLRPVDASSLQFLLVLGEEVLVEEVLQSLIGDVN